MESELFGHRGLGVLFDEARPPGFVLFVFGMEGMEEEWGDLLVHRGHYMTSLSISIQYQGVLNIKYPGSPSP